MTVFVVSGIKRSGTSMMMNILLDGGIDILTDNRYKADKWNPNGYFEWHSVMHNRHEPEILRNADGKAVKIIAITIVRHTTDALIPEKDYKVIWMERDHKEAIMSWEIKNGRNKYHAIDSLIEKVNSYEMIRNSVHRWFNEQPNIEFISVNYKDVIYHAEREIKKIQDFLGVKLNLEKAINVVDEKLYKVRY